MAKPPKIGKAKLLGYYIGAGSQQFGTGRAYRCAWCKAVWRTVTLCEAHEKICTRIRRPERERAR